MTDRQRERCTDRQRERCSDRQRDRKTDRATERQTVRQTVRLLCCKKTQATVNVCIMTERKTDVLRERRIDTL